MIKKIMIIIIIMITIITIMIFDIAPFPSIMFKSDL